MQHAILLHEAADDVGVAVRDLKVGEEVSTVTLDGEPVGAVKLVNDVPLGHKVAMRAMPNGHKVIEYGRPIGGTSRAIAQGAHVHTHNLKTLRWAL